MSHVETVKGPKEELGRPQSESQNHGMIEVGRDLWRSCSLNPAKTGLPRGGAQDHVQADFEYLHDLSGQPVSMLCHPHSKEAFPHI